MHHILRRKEGKGKIIIPLCRTNVTSYRDTVLYHLCDGVQAADRGAVWWAASHACNKMYPSIKLLLSLTICVRRLGFTPTLTLCYCRTCLSDGRKQGGIRLRLTDGESGARLVQHLLSRWWKKSEDWVHSWNSKHASWPWCVCVCVCTSYLLCDLQSESAYTQKDRCSRDVVVLKWNRFVPSPGWWLVQYAKIEKAQYTDSLGRVWKVGKSVHKTASQRYVALKEDGDVHMEQMTGHCHSCCCWSDFLFSLCLGFISSSVQFVQKDQRPSRDSPWPGNGAVSCL